MRRFFKWLRIALGVRALLFAVCLLLVKTGKLGPPLVLAVLRDLSRQAFREHLSKSNDPSLRYIINFTRQAIFGSGGGHHSPVAGYLEPEDLVLVLDVNQSFRPWLLQRERLYAAIDTLHGAKNRGLLLIE